MRFAAGKIGIREIVRSIRCDVIDSSLICVSYDTHPMHNKIIASN